MRPQALQDRADMTVVDEFFSWSRAIRRAHYLSLRTFRRHCVLRYAGKWMVCRYTSWSDRA